MPKLDFLTLYVVILFNALTVCVIWAGVVATYRDFKPPRIWLASMVLALIGGVVLSLQGAEDVLWLAVSGNTMVVYSFCMTWIGLRYFYGDRKGWVWGAVIALVAFSIMAASGDYMQARFMTHSTAQSVVMIMIAVYLWKRSRDNWGLGNSVAFWALVLGVAANSAETLFNIATWWGHIWGNTLTIEDYDLVQSYALTVTIYSCVCWNFGFIIMTVNRQHGDVLKVAQTDELTGLPNRRSFMSKLEIARQDLIDDGVGYSVLLIDVDNFKSWNDTYGHAFGDQALVHFAEITGKILKPHGLLARTGGDEFSALLTGVDEAGAMAIARNILQTMRQLPLKYEDQLLTISLSIGVAAVMTVMQDVEHDVLERADMALYKAKQAGRNCFATSTQVSSGDAPPQLRLIVGERPG